MKNCGISYTCYCHNNWLSYGLVFGSDPDRSMAGDDGKENIDYSNNRVREMKGTVMQTALIGAVSPAQDPVKAMLEIMTLDEKIGQLFIVSLRSFKETEPVLTADGKVESVLKNIKSGELFSLLKI